MPNCCKVRAPLSVIRRQRESAMPANTSNAEDWPLPGPQGLGTEFTIPLHKHAPFYNNTFQAPQTRICLRSVRRKIVP